MEIYSIKDVKAGIWNTPFNQPTDVHALRAFKAEINRANDQNMAYLYPEDYELHHLGQFDEKSGVLTTNGKGLLANGASLRTPGQT